MIPVLIGLNWRHQKLGVITLRHPACGDDLECSVEEARQKFTIFLIPTITTDRRYLFTWTHCERTFAIADKAQVEEYRQRIALAGGQPVVPEVETLVPYQVYRPVPVNLRNCLFVAIAALLMFLCGAILIGLYLTFLR